jgi:ribose 5-phosphate isomerase A
MDVTAAKRRAGEAAAEAVSDGMTVGLGTGSTAAHAIDALGERVDAGLEIQGVPTSFQSRQRAREAGVPLVPLPDTDGIDLAIDGADQVIAASEQPRLGDCIKGGGAAHAREKLVAAAADRLALVVDERKLAVPLDHAVPVEVLPAAREHVAARVRELGGEPTLRTADRKDGPVVTDNGNLVLDCAFGAIEDLETLATALDGLAGTVEHGLFVGLADAVYVGTPTGVERRERE